MMYLTEEEARKKWCPQVRVSRAEQTIRGNHTSNRDADGQNIDGSNCIASECMMWRGATEPSEHAKGALENAKRTGDIGQIQEAENICIKYVTKYGYCGLAGKP